MQLARLSQSKKTPIIRNSYAYFCLMLCMLCYLVSLSSFPSSAQSSSSHKKSINSKRAPLAHNPPSKLSYETSILPLMRLHCGGCHSASGNAGFDIRTYGSVLQGGRSGKAVIPGSPDSSLLYNLVSTHKMPPGPAQLTSNEIAVVKNWITNGAHGGSSPLGHWAFRTPVSPAPPTVIFPYSISEISNPIDAFLLQELKKSGISFSPEADKHTLIRRLTFDLLGVAPSVAEVQSFVHDTGGDAYGRLVDRLLADPRHGERWARFWLDTAGYADSEGILEEDKIRPNAWRYRDYVIRSLNSDMPYDQFLKEQIAGDEISGYRTAAKWSQQIEDAVTATGFLRTAVDATRNDFNAHQFEEYQFRMLNDTQTILVSTTLGITLQCARCHDHKYEPLTQKDYYGMQATLAGAVRPEGKLISTYDRQIVAATSADQKLARENDERLDKILKAYDIQSAALTLKYRLKWTELKAKAIPEASKDVVALLAALRAETAKLTKDQTSLIEKYKGIDSPSDANLISQYPEYKSAVELINMTKTEQQSKRITYPQIRALYDQDNAPPEWHILLRGEYLKKGIVVEPSIPRILDSGKNLILTTAAPGSSQTTGRRTALANWIARADNPLTARVEVNRIWSHHFGVGLVSTLDNFGQSGSPPTNQALLDWLANAFAHGLHGKAWSRKDIHRLIVSSVAYRQSSYIGSSVQAVKIDPENKLLWRQREHRLEAEAIRDAVLQCAGTLDSKMYGEPIGEVTLPTGEIVPEGETGGGRRSVYLLVRRSKPVTFLNSFDLPVMETNCTRRTDSTTPLQALALMNGSFIQAQANKMAKQILKDIGSNSTVRVQVNKAVALAYQREPTNANNEVQVLEAFLSTGKSQYNKLPNAGETAELRALADLCAALLSSNEFLYVD